MLPRFSASYLAPIVVSYAQRANRGDSAQVATKAQRPPPYPRAAVGRCVCVATATR